MKKTIITMTLFILGVVNVYSQPMEQPMKKVRIATGEWSPYVSQSIEGHGVITEIVTAVLNDMEVEHEYLFLYFYKCYDMVKKGEYGVSMVSDDTIFLLPAFPVEKVVDPTGAGDSFGGGFMGALAEAGTVDRANLRKALAYGNVLASFTVQDFSLNRLKSLDESQILERFEQFNGMVNF